MRQRDLHILTSALHTYTNDWRISSIHTVVREDQKHLIDKDNASAIDRWSSKLNANLNVHSNDQELEDEEDGIWSEWTLRIRAAHVKDTGLYECQVSTEPKISQIYRLNIVGTFSILFFSSY